MIIPSLPAIPSPTVNLPTPSLPNLQCSTKVLTTLLSRDGPECTDIFHCRTKANIVLSCLTTILACTWVALHPDAPEGNKSMLKSVAMKVLWMVSALIAPELITGKAMSDRLKAKRHMDRWNANFVSLCSPERVAIRGKTARQYERELKRKKYDSRWTLTHGYLAEMNGIEIYNDKDSRERFEPKQSIFEDPKMRAVIQQIGLISTKDIQDKSKGDSLSKSLVVIQTSWFVLQCLARWATHLPVTELEVVTLAYAMLNIFIYALWWNKPQSLSVRYILYLEDDKELPNNSVANGHGNEEEIPLMRRSLIPDTIGEEPILNEWVEPTQSGALYMEPDSVAEPIIAGLLAGVIFGAFHLIPIWLSVFPSNVQKLLWKVSAIYVTVAPVGIPLVMILDAADAPQSAPYYQQDVLRFICACGTVVYVVMRIILLVLPLITLRSLPMEALLSVEWTRFIPHL